MLGIIKNGLREKKVYYYYVFNIVITDICRKKVHHYLKSKMENILDFLINKVEKEILIKLIYQVSSFYS